MLQRILKRVISDPNLIKFVRTKIIWRFLEKKRFNFFQKPYFCINIGLVDLCIVVKMCVVVLPSVFRRTCKQKFCKTTLFQAQGTPKRIFPHKFQIRFLYDHFTHSKLNRTFPKSLIIAIRFLTQLILSPQTKIKHNLFLNISCFV